MLGLFLARYRSALVRIQGNVVVKTSRADAAADDLGGAARLVDASLLLLTWRGRTTDLFAALLGEPDVRSS